MTILERIDKDAIKALKAGEKDRVTVLRGLKSDLKYKRISLGEDLTEEQAIEVLSSAAKKRRESIEQYGNAGRDDLVQKETSELKVIAAYLPKQLSEDELRRMIAEAIEETGADSPQKMGLIMKNLIPKLKGKADGKLVSRLVSEILAN